MSIRCKPEPPNARTLLGSALTRRANHARHIHALRGTAKVAGPLPVYTLSYKSSSRAHPLRYIRLAGWTYVIVGGATSGLAHLRLSRGTLHFAGITDGPAAQLLIDATLVAERELQAIKRSFEARILEIPYLRIHALWLYSLGGASRFLSLDSVIASGTAPESLRGVEARISSASAHLVSRARHALTP
jgi:hypothetical protein